MNRTVTIAFGLCFALSLTLIARGQQISGGGGGSPGGATTQVQFNNAGAFGGSANLVWDNTNKILSMGTLNASQPGALASYFRVVNTADGTSVVGRLSGSNTGIELVAVNGNALILTGGNSSSQAVRLTSLARFDSSLVDGTYVFSTPSTGFTLTLTDFIWHTILDPAGTLATGTITMPPNPVDGQIINVRSSQVITGLTVSPNTSQSIKGNPTTLAVGGTFECMFRSPNTTWYC